VINKKKISIGSWAFCLGPYEKKVESLNTVLPGIRKLGYDGIELTGVPAHFHPSVQKNDDDIKKLKDLLKENNIEVPATAPGLGDFRFADCGETAKADYVSEFRKFAKLSAGIGAQNLRVDTVTPAIDAPTIDYVKAQTDVVDIFQQCCDIAGEIGLKVVWEFEPCFMFNKISEVTGIIDGINRPNFNILYDTAHAYMCCVKGFGQVEPKEISTDGDWRMLKALKDKIGLVHLIDSDGSLYQGTSAHLPLGRGDLDFCSIIPEIENSGYGEHWWTIDLFGWDDIWPLVGESINYLRRDVWNLD
jgi:sugar phosphate isomerase/epimerase